LVVACDLFELQSGWLDSLQRASGEQHRAVVFRGDRWQPFPGLYHTALRAAVEGQLRRGERAMAKLLADAHPVVLPLPRDWPELAQANRVSDLARYAAARSRPASRRG
jgi:molybdopterin-guanine dinucleotide biosynthesis protein A